MIKAWSSRLCIDTCLLDLLHRERMVALLLTAVDVSCIFHAEFTSAIMEGPLSYHHRSSSTHPLLVHLSPLDCANMSLLHHGSCLALFFRCCKGFAESPFKYFEMNVVPFLSESFWCSSWVFAFCRCFVCVTIVFLYFLDASMAAASISLLSVQSA